MVSPGIDMYRYTLRTHSALLRCEAERSQACGVLYSMNNWQSWRRRWQQIQKWEASRHRSRLHISKGISTSCRLMPASGWRRVAGDREWRSSPLHCDILKANEINTWPLVLDTTASSSPFPAGSTLSFLSKLKICSFSSFHRLDFLPYGPIQLLCTVCLISKWR